MTPRPGRAAAGLGARAAALQVLQRVEEEDAYAEILLDHTLEREKLSDPDKRLAYELVLGTLRHQGRLDYLIGLLADRPVAKLDPTVRRLLRLGAYQLMLLDRIPPSAAVNESVKLASERTRPYVNGVLRQLARKKNELENMRPADQVERLAALESHPAWLVERWLRELGEAETEALCRANNRRPRLTVRVNPLRAGRDELRAQWAKAGIAAEPTNLSPLGLRLVESMHPRELPGFAEGRFAVQDEASQLVGLLVGVQPGERVLDACAAPGTKTLQLAQLAGGQANLTATDQSEPRLNLLEREAERMGIKALTIRRVDWRKSPPALGRFDRILVDAPCSGLGTLRRHPEIKWRLQPGEISELARLQKRILQTVAGLLRPGGILVYATCTLTAEENEAVVQTLTEGGGFEMVDAADHLPPSARATVEAGRLRTWPHRQGTDGFTAHRLVRA